MTPQQGSVLSQYYNSQRQGRRSPDTQGLANDIRIGPDRRTAGYDFLGNLVYLDTGERVKNQDMPEDLLPSNFYPNQYNGSADSAIPEDLSQPMVGPNSAYGPYYELGPFGPYDTRDINDSRHPDNPNNRQVPDVAPDNYQQETGLQDPTEIRTVSKEQQAAYEKFIAELDARSRAAAAEAAAGERTAAAEAELAADNYQDYPHRGGVGPTRENYDPSLDPDYDPNYNPYQHQAYGLGDLEDQIGYDPRPRPQVAPDEPYPQVAPDVPLFDPKPASYLGPGETPLPQLGTPPSAGYLRSTGEGGAGLNSYYDEINAYLANHSQDEVQQAMGTYGVSQEDVDAARAYQQPQYARGGLSRMLRKVNRKVR